MAGSIPDNKLYKQSAAWFTILGGGLATISTYLATVQGDRAFKATLEMNGRSTEQQEYKDSNSLRVAGLVLFVVVLLLTILGIMGRGAINSKWMAGKGWLMFFIVVMAPVVASSTVAFSLARRQANNHQDFISSADDITDPDKNQESLDSYQTATIAMFGVVMILLVAMWYTKYYGM